MTDDQQLETLLDDVDEKKEALRVARHAVEVYLEGHGLPPDAHSVYVDGVRCDVPNGWTGIVREAQETAAKGAK